MKVLKSIYDFLQEIGRIRAASHLARKGDHAGAQKLMSCDLKG